ncbi:MAG: hypothetical protein VW683_17435 [Betaproteobacteria bacterium]
MKSKRRYAKNDKVLVKSFAGPDVCVRLVKRYLPSKAEHKIGVEGWEAIIEDSKEVNKLRSHGVPYNKQEKPKVWVFDNQIIKRCH